MLTGPRGKPLSAVQEWVASVAALASEQYSATGGREKGPGHTDPPPRHAARKEPVTREGVPRAVGVQDSERADPEQRGGSRGLDRAWASLLGEGSHEKPGSRLGGTSVDSLSATALHFNWLLLGVHLNFRQSAAKVLAQGPRAGTPGSLHRALR